MQLGDLFRVVSDLRKRSRALGSDTSGLAMVEFAMSLPIFLALSMVGIETANMALATLRVNQIAMMVADNAGRVRNSIDESDINEVMIGARFTGDSIGLGTNGRVILSSFQSNNLPAPLTGNYIVWQRCYGAKNVTSSYGVEGDGLLSALLAAGMGPASQKIVPVAGTAVMFVEVNYTYKPVVSDSIFGTRTITATAAFTVRQRSAETLSNSSNLTTAQKRLCDSAHLSAT